MQAVIPAQLKIDPAWLPAGARGLERAVVRFSAPERQVLRKKKAPRPSVWVERHRVVPDDSAVAGPWKNATTPYLAGIMDASFYPSVQEIYIVAPPQTGKSECVNNCLGYATDTRPGNALVVYPDELTGRDNMRDRLVPMYEDSARLRRYFTGADDDKTSLCLRLKHMKIHVGWANSAARLANKPLPYGVGDEVGKWPKTAGKKEASPIDLLRKRMRTFGHMRKLWLTSTPNVEDDWIWVALTQWAEAVFDYWVRCPLCGERQQMTFKRVRWEGGGEADPREIERVKGAWYECAGCAGKWDDATRNRAAVEGEWRERVSGLSLFTHLESRQPLKIAFHYRAYISSRVSLSESAAAFLWGIKDKTSMKDFHNGHDTEPWRAYGEERDEARVLALRDGRPPGRVPGDGVIAGLTAGVDTQDVGCWFIIVAWSWGGKDMARECHVVRMGLVADEAGVEQVLWRDAYHDAQGVRYVPAISLRDSAGHRTSDVYTFCRKHPGKIVPTIGRDTMAQPFTWGNVEYWPGTKKPIRGGLKLLNVNTKYYKDDLAGRLEILPGDPGGIRFCGDDADVAQPGALSFDYAGHFCSEYVDEKGAWACPAHKPNHLWDCLVLASCAYDVVGMAHWAKTPAPGRPATEKDGERRKRWNDGGGYKPPSWVERM